MSNNAYEVFPDKYCLDKFYSVTIGLLPLSGSQAYTLIAFCIYTYS